jgi:uncharacterized protein
MATVTQLWYYPVKSLAGISVTEAYCGPKGLAWDRRWMLVDQAGVFLSQRKFPEMALLQPELSFEEGRPVQMVITHCNHPDHSLVIPAADLFGEKPQNVTVWDSTLTVNQLAPYINNWFSAVLGMPCSMVYQAEDQVRKVDPNYAKSQTDQTSLSDGYPYLLVGESSLQLLEEKIGEPITINRFRPNIVFEGEAPHFEDVLSSLTIGEATFEGVKPCARCEVVTIDPATAFKNKMVLKTLSTYRTKNNKVYFGQNLLISTFGMVRLGNAIHWKVQ